MANNEIYHYGILGMKWGKRKTNYSSDAAKVRDIRKKKVSEMSNKELQEANNRINLENNYRNLTKKKGIGKKAVTAIVATAGTLAALEGAAKTYSKVGKGVVDKLGDFVIKDLNKHL